jgi:hypothetical protein
MGSLSGLIGIIPAMAVIDIGIFAVLQGSGNPFIANLIAALLIDLRQAQEDQGLGRRSKMAKGQGESTEINWG